MEYLYLEKKIQFISRKEIHLIALSSCLQNITSLKVKLKTVKRLYIVNVYKVAVTDIAI